MGNHVSFSCLISASATVAPTTAADTVRLEIPERYRGAWARDASGCNSQPSASFCQLRRAPERNQLKDHIGQRNTGQNRPRSALFAPHVEPQRYAA